jgi:pimeloyl-ACP methyl ester carboxylesterase
MAEVVASDGVTLYAEAHGEGTPVLLSCGLCTTHVNWRPQVEPLAAAGFRVVIWDYRGHGRSGVPEAPAAYTIEHVVDDIGRVLEWAAPGVPAVVGGLSFGGLASLHFALRHPGRVRGLLLVDSGPGFKNPEAQARWEGQVERTASFAENKGLAAFVKSKASVTTVGLQPELPSAIAAGKAIAAQDPKGIANFARRIAGPAPPVIDELASISAPALVVVGEKDAPYLRAAEVMAARIPDAEHVTIPGAGHIVNIEKPEAFNEIVIRFLRRIAASAA